MELHIKQDKKNALLHRKEVEGTLSYQGATPSNAQLTEALSKKFGVGADSIAVKHIYGSFGAQNATFDAHVYDSKEHLLKVEPKQKVKADANAPAAK